MFTIMFIHVLEATVAVLLAATAVQLFRCNRSFYQANQIPAAATRPKVLPNTADKAYSSSASILHDYIGEFFIDEAMANELKDYQNIETTRVTAAKNTKAKAQNLANKSEASNVFNFEDNTKASPEKMRLDEDEDTVITVMSPVNAPKGSTEDKVMSDKVVHAMLDEAKLVCAS